MLINTDLDAEKRWLTYVLQTVAERLEDARRVGGSYAGRALEERRSLWEEGARNITSYDDWIELAQASTQIGQGERSVAFYQAQAHQLERMQDAPYFGRVDFRENGRSGVDAIYIGIAGLHHPTSGELLVYDWRAPISSLFYDAEPGLAQYECQDGVIAGKMLLKRQYRITHGELQFMFDTDLKIDDSMLQELLARNIDEKMRTIVSSIQREQNRVIRDSKHNLLVVQGPAGSGKTAIALHRAAYLLYNHRDRLSARNIVIFSPNQVFSDYISAVLPELGEENIMQTTFHEYAEKYLGGSLPVEDMYTQLEYLLAEPPGVEHVDRAQAIRYKASDDFHQVLRKYVEYLEEGKATSFPGVKVAHQELITQREMVELFQRHKELPLGKRLEKIRQRALFLMGPLEEERLKYWKTTLAAAPEHMLDWEIRQESRRRTRAEFDPVKNWLGNWATLDIMALYRRLFQDQRLLTSLAASIGTSKSGPHTPPEWERIRRYTLANLTNGRINYEDATPLLYLKRRLTGAPILPTVKHVIIDEAQDYTPLQYELINLVFPRCNMTVLGDLHQSVHPYMHIGAYDSVLSALKREQAVIVRLSKSYRSTRQIMDFSRSMLSVPDDVEVVRKEGPKPRIVKVEGYRTLIDALAKDIRNLQTKGIPSVAVLCKTAAQSVRVHQQLQQKLHKSTDGEASVNIRLITTDTAHFQTGAVVLPAYLAKGLEFDAVLLADVSDRMYRDETERGLLYTACTRALHELHLYCTGVVTPLIADVDRSLYDEN